MIEPEDEDALQYAGQQLLCVPDARQAYQYFVQLQNVADRKRDDLLSSRSKVLQAQALYALPTPNLTSANVLLLDVTSRFPAQLNLLDRAKIHELHGDIRRDSDFQNAHDSYIDALTHYARENELSSSVDAAAGVARVTKKITDLNELDSQVPSTINFSNPTPATTISVPASQPQPRGPKVGA